jgi:hypothetical protein
MSKPIHLAVKSSHFVKYWFRACRPEDLCWVSDRIVPFLTEDPAKVTCKRCRHIIGKEKL